MSNNLELEKEYNTYVKEYVMDSSEDKTPIPFRKYQNKLSIYKENGEPIIVEDSGFPYTESYKMYITYVGSHWVGGYSESFFNGERVKIPRTVHYSDLYITHPNYKKKIIFVEENPYEF